MHTKNACCAHTHTYADGVVVASSQPTGPLYSQKKPAWPGMQSAAHPTAAGKAVMDDSALSRRPLKPESSSTDVVEKKLVRSNRRVKSLQLPLN